MRVKESEWKKKLGENVCVCVCVEEKICQRAIHVDVLFICHYGTIDYSTG